MVGRVKRALAVLAATAAAGSVMGAAPAAAAPTKAENFQCSCVLYVRNQTGLPGGPAVAADYTDAVMKRAGWSRIGTPFNGSVLVWDRHQKGAAGAGHMAIVTGSDQYAQGARFLISVRHVNWGGNCGVHGKQFKWNDLNGVRAYAKFGR